MSAFLNEPENEANRVFIQWKGTDACFDFHCDCGEHCHFDGYFAYVVKCPACGQEWEMPSLLAPRKVCEHTYSGHTPKLMEGEDE